MSESFPDFLRAHGVPEEVVQKTIKARRRKLQERTLNAVPQSGMIDFSIPSQRTKEDHVENL